MERETGLCGVLTKAKILVPVLNIDFAPLTTNLWFDSNFGEQKSVNPPNFLILIDQNYSKTLLVPLNSFYWFAIGAVGIDFEDRDSGCDHHKRGLQCICYMAV